MALGRRDVRSCEQRIYVLSTTPSDNARPSWSIFCASNQETALMLRSIQGAACVFFPLDITLKTRKIITMILPAFSALLVESTRKFRSSFFLVLQWKGWVCTSVDAHHERQRLVCTSVDAHRERRCSSSRHRAVYVFFFRFNIMLKARKIITMILPTFLPCSLVAHQRPAVLLFWVSSRRLVCTSVDSCREQRCFGRYRAAVHVLPFVNMSRLKLARSSR